MSENLTISLNETNKYINENRSSINKKTSSNQINNTNFNKTFNSKFYIPMKNNERNFLESSIKSPSRILNKSNNNNEKKNKSLSKTFGKKKMEYDKFNFGSKKSSPLKKINTTILTAHLTDKNNYLSIQKNRKSSILSKENNKDVNNAKYMLGFPLIKSIKKEQEKENYKNQKSIDLIKDRYITNHNGIAQLPLLSSILAKTKVKLKQNYEYKKCDEKDSIIKKCMKEKEYKKVNDILDEDNQKMQKKIEEKFKALDEKIKKYNLKRPNEETDEGYEVLFKKYNKKRGERNNIITNRALDLNKKKEDLININTLEEIEYCKKNKYNNILLDVRGKQRYLIDTENNNIQKNAKISEYELISLTNQANRRVEKLFPDLFTFDLPKVLRQNKEYSLKLLYDVFIEFKTLLKCGMIHNRNLNLHKTGIDFETFFNCNTKINQQGIALSKKIFKAFNSKTNINYMPWENYMDGMMKIKDPNIDNKLDLFFQILDENGDGSFDYNEVFNLSLISLQRVLPEEPSSKNKSEEKDNKDEDNKKNKDEDDKKNKEDEEPNITNILAEFLTKYVFELVGIDIDGEIPIDLLREKMDEKDAESEYLEFFLCADNFA